MLKVHLIKAWPEQCDGWGSLEFFFGKKCLQLAASITEHGKIWAEI